MAVKPPEDPGSSGVEIERVTALVVRSTRSRSECPPLEAEGAVERLLVLHGAESAHDPDLDPRRVSRPLHAQECLRRADLDRLPFETRELDPESAAMLVANRSAGRDPIGRDTVRTDDQSPTMVRYRFGDWHKAQPTNQTAKQKYKLLHGSLVEGTETTRAHERKKENLLNLSCNHDEFYFFSSFERSHKESAQKISPQTVSVDA